MSLYEFFEKVQGLLDKARLISLTFLAKVTNLLTGEPARAIGYGAAVVVYLVARLVGAIPDVPWETAVVQTGAVITVLVTVIESIRSFVFSTNTVVRLVDELDSMDYRIEHLQAVIALLQVQLYNAEKQSASTITIQPDPSAAP